MTIIEIYNRLKSDQADQAAFPRPNHAMVAAFEQEVEKRLARAEEAEERIDALAKNLTAAQDTVQELTVGVIHLRECLGRIARGEYYGKMIELEAQRAMDRTGLLALRHKCYAHYHDVDLSYGDEEPAL